MPREVGMTMTSAGDAELVAQARAGDELAFAQLAEPHRYKLQVHAYRMLGSAQDAEDAVQETLLRGWQSLGNYGGQSSFGSWLYGISTHVCLDALRRRKSRRWPTWSTTPNDPLAEPAAPTDIPWIEPYPDRLLELAAPAGEGPEALVIARETVELAFLTAIQQLPARQRAVLLLRDVLEWSARETASVLEMTEVAVNSALQRARVRLTKVYPDRRTVQPIAVDAVERALLDKFIAAWENADVDALVTLLSEDAKFVMPPRPTWFRGRHAIATFIASHVFPAMGTDWRLVPAKANMQPAFAMYWRGAEMDHFEFHAIGTLGIVNGAIDDIVMFLDPNLSRQFELPDRL